MGTSDAGGPAPYLLRGLELATSAVMGRDADVTPLRRCAAPSPRAALESIALEALRRPPCVVAFSGGRDSSAVLALAAHVARREGLSLPVPFTNRFPADEQAEESEWQELVVRHLGLDSWERRDFTSELDIVGPIATDLLNEWGAYFPFNAHFLIPAMDAAVGGTLLTGVGGDEVLQMSRRNRLGAVLLGSQRPTRNLWSTAAAAALPLALRQRAYRRNVDALPWLQRPAAEDYRRKVAADIAGQPIWNAEDLDDFWQSRGRAARTATISAVAASRSVRVRHPLEHSAFLAAVIAQRPRVGWRTRLEAMVELFGDVLPESTLRRRTKAGFARSFFSMHSRAFVAGWTGAGIDRGVVDADALLDTWRQPVVDGRSYSLLQSAWLAARTRQ